MANPITKWLRERRLKAALKPYDEALERARKSHKPIKHIINAKKRLLHEYMGGV